MSHQCLTGVSPGVTVLAAGGTACTAPLRDGALPVRVPGYSLVAPRASYVPDSCDRCPNTSASPPGIWTWCGLEGHHGA